MESALLVYQAVVLAATVLLLGNTVVNMLVLPTAGKARRKARLGDGKTGNSTEEPALVSVLVPARNEEGSIGPCIASLIAQDHPRIQLLLLDDHSEDATRQEAIAAGLTEAQILTGRPLPEGWAGKNWACHQLSEAADGDWLLFTDADTLHQPDSVSAALALAEKEDASLLSAWPRQLMGSWSEVVIIPMVYYLAGAFLPHIVQRLARRKPGLLARLLPASLLRKFGAANGQYMFFSRQGYQLVGGHASAPGHLVEDVALGQATMERSAEGGRLVNADGHRIVNCRMYSNWPELSEGFSKNLRPLFEGSDFQFCLAGLYQVVFQILPFVFLFLTSGTMLTFVTAQVATICLVRAILAIRLKTPLWIIPLHPFAVLLALWIGILSWQKARTGKLTWKGRAYSHRGKASP